MINIKEVSWTNFLGYGNYVTKIDLSKYTGVCLIEGKIEEDREAGDEKLCGAGKSSIIEAIVWILFGNLTSKESIGDKVINWDTKCNCKGSIKTTDGYEIIRTRKYNGISELLIFKDGENITTSTLVPAQQLISEIFNINYRLFINSRIFGQFNSGFLEQSDMKIRNILEKLMKIDNLNDIAETAKTKLNKIKEDKSVLEAKKESLLNEIESNNVSIQSLLMKESEYDCNKQKRIDTLKSKVPLLMAESKEKIRLVKTTIDADKNILSTIQYLDLDIINEEWVKYDKECLKYSNIIVSAKKEKDKCQKEINSIRNINTGELIDIEKCKKDNKMYQEIRDKLNEFRKNESNLRSNLKINKIKINDNNVKLSKLKSSHDVPCETCLRPFTPNDKELYNKMISELNQDILNLQSQIESDKEKLDEIVKNIEILEEKSSNKPMSINDAENVNDRVSKLIIEKNLASNKHKELLSRISSCDKLISSFELKLKSIVKPSMTINEASFNNKYYNQILSGIKTSEESIISINDDFKLSLESIKSDIDSIISGNNPYSDMVAESKLNIVNLQNKVDVIQKELDSNYILFNHVDYIRESYNNKKRIKSFWGGRLIPQFNEYLAYYLKFFEIEDRIEFDSLLSVKMDRWSYDTHSGGERKGIDLSMFFALSDLYTANFGQQSNFYVLDEVDGRLDPFTINKLCTLLNDDIIKRDNGVSNIFIISHRHDMKDRFPHKIKVKNKSGLSYIINEQDNHN